MSVRKILVIDNSMDVTGALNAIIRTAVTLRDKFEFVFVLPQGSAATWLPKENGFPVYTVPMLEISRRWKSLLYIPSLLRSWVQVRKILRREKIELVHVNDFYNLIMALGRFLGSKVRYVCYVNFVPDRFPALLRNFWIASHIRFADRIIAVSKHVLKQLPENNKVTCISNALPITNALAFDELPNKKNYLLYMSNFMKGKGQDDAIAAFASVAPSFPDWKLRMVGGDMGLEKNKVYRNLLMKHVKNGGVEGQVEWIDFSNNVSKEYYDASVALNFSVSESFSLTVQEAMYYGCPVIATKSGGPAEIIENERTGILVDVHDVKAMASAMTSLMSNPAKRKTLSAQAWKSIREKYDYEHTSAKLSEVYASSVSLNS